MCDLAVKISKWRHMQLFKTCVQNKLGFLFLFWSLINIVGLMLSATGKQMQCVFSVVFLMLCYKNALSKQAEICFLVYQATFVIWKMCVQSKRDATFSLSSYFYGTKKTGLLFSLFGYFCNTKYLCSNQASKSVKEVDF